MKLSLSIAVLFLELPELPGKKAKTGRRMVPAAGSIR
jgi:hypothetical protein